MGENVTPVAPARLDRAETAVESYKRKEDRILGLNVALVGRVTGDIPVAASIAMGAKQNLERLRADLERLQDGGVAVAALDELEDLALAAFYAELQYQSVLSSKELTPLIERARYVREITLGAAEMLAKVGIFNVTVVTRIREGAGNIDLAKDLMALGALFSANWELAINKVPFGLDLVNESSQLGPRLLRAIGVSEVGEVRKDPSYDWDSLRARAFRLLVNCYEELRRAVTYLRWFEGDAKLFAPTLHPRLVTQPVKPGGTQPQTPPADDDLPGAETSNAGQVVTTPPASGVAPGLKGGSPFAAE